MKRNKILGIAMGMVLGFSLLWNGTGQEPVQAASPVTIDETNFPDEIFRNYVKDNFDNDGDGVLSVDEIEAVDEISVARLGGICDLTGVEYFANLEYLQCSNNKIKTLDLSKNTNLIYLDCMSNGMVSLNVSSCTKLKQLRCSWNELNDLDVKNCILLETLECNINNLRR